MKKYLMIFLAVLLFSTAVSAQTQGYIGLFTDDTHTSWCQSDHVSPQFTMWIFALGKAGGTYGAEFMIQMPADPTLIMATLTPHPEASAAIIGHPSTGVSFTWLTCQEGWTWIYQVLMIDTSGNQNTIAIVPHPTAGGPNFVDCEDPRPLYDAVVFNNFYVNYVNGVDAECDETGVAPASWGAIKSLYTE